MSVQLAMFEALSERDRILQAFAQNHPAYLAGLRAYARDIARRTGEVTIDEVRAAIERDGYPMPQDIGCDARVFGTLFKTSEFRAIGMRRTTRSAWAARVGRSRDAVTVYALRDTA